MDSYTTLSVTPDNFYHKLIDHLRFIFTKSTGYFRFDSETDLVGEEHNTINLPYLKNIIIDYLNYLLTLKKISDFNIEEAYKIVSNNISGNKDYFKIINYLKIYNLDLYNNIIKFNTPTQIKLADSMSKSGFND